MSTVKTLVKTVTVRAWHDLEPKLIAFLTTGLSAAVVTEAANYVGFQISPALAVAISTVVASIAGYVKSSTATELVPTAPVVVPSAPVVVSSPDDAVSADVVAGV